MAASPSLTVSLCIPSSCIRESNAFNLAQATTVAHQIARLASMFKIVEVIVLDIPQNTPLPGQSSTVTSTLLGNKKKVFDLLSPEETHDAQGDLKGEDAYLLATLLQYFVTPPYLVNSLFKPADRKLLRYAKRLPKLTTLPFLNGESDAKFKEGFSIPKRSPASVTKSKKSKPQKKLQVTKYVNIGSEKPIELKQDVPVNVRLTIDLKERKVVSPQTAYNSRHNEVGYIVRYAKNLTSVFVESSVDGGYTETVFVNADDYFPKSERVIPTFVKKSNGSVLLLVGKWQDFESCTTQDPNIPSINDLIDCQLKVPAKIRIEDAACISMSKIFESE